MGIKPIISRTSDGKKSEEIAHAGNLMPSLRSALSYSHSLQHSSKGKRLSVGGIITPSSVQLGSIKQEEGNSSGWMDIKFCKTNLLIEHKELDGIPIQVHTPIGWPFQASPAQP
ncbi:unnamed protein product [Microthlaspi erraticum]|uniref:Uncharacterized protein n=1 Tax=Microthlaspi erraticum TaxID=1685480 RepID=A0A6D2K3K8_9BRAS|nr:unnamed protein product [Microthlaspi erraticum]